jgi:lysyl-tRNA synthetase class 2
VTEHTPSTPHSADSSAHHAEPPLHEQEAARRANRQAVADLGLHPYGSVEPDLITLADAFERYDPAADDAHKAGTADDRPRVTVAGRIVLRRPSGKLVWMNLRDHTHESFQVAVSKKDCDEAGFAVAQNADLGDIVVVEGPLMRTKTGEVTCWASAVRPGAKSLTPPPSKHEGLQDVELRYRQRYVDMWATPRTTRVFELRSRVVAEMRRFLIDRGYLEVETPMLQPQAGGAAARPFVTHMNALDLPLYMRIAPELYLKRLLVGGLPRVFEINRNFRNEGLDKQHNPEFTMLELYHAFGDCETVMAVTEDLVRHSARVAAHARSSDDGVDADHLVLPFGELLIDYGRPFDRVSYAELFERGLGFSMHNLEKVRAEAQARGLKLKNEKGERLDDIFLVNELFEEFAEPALDPARPTFITHYPASLSPLTRPNRENPALADRADLFIAGMEVGPHYTELNDPDVQADKFREQLAGLDDEESTFRSFDEDFIAALKVGMPPAGGLGLGVDRLMMLLADQPTIRDVVLFPLMRPAGR